MHMRRLIKMTSITQWILVTLVVGLAMAMVGCNATTPKRWVGEAGDEQLQLALSECRVYVKEEFNPYEDFSDRALGSLPVERNLNRRIAFRRMLRDCMAEQGFRLEPVSAL